MPKSEVVTVLLLALATVFAISAACGKAEPTPTPVPHLSARAIVSPSPISQVAALTPAEAQALEELAVAYEELTKAWEEFHADFDAWREGLLTCDASSMKVSLQRFAADFVRVTQRATDLTRPPSVRNLADGLIRAAEGEERALRELRDRWNPDAPELLEAVESQRSLADAVQAQVTDALADLEDKVSPSSRDLVADFSKALEKLTSDWDAFHTDYDSFRSSQSQLTPFRVLGRLNELVTQFSEVAAQARLLPASPLTTSPARILIDAAREEELALRKLKDIFRMTDITTTEAVLATNPQFEGFDAQLVATNTRRREAAEFWVEVIKASSTSTEVELKEFSKDYDALLSTWNAFHEEYDTWRHDEGGCDRVKARERLGEFVLRLGQIGASARALPRLQPLQPLQEVLIEALEREERALRALRSKWRPFDAGVYEEFEAERVEAGKLNRQVAAGLNQLLTQYNVSTAGPAR